MKLGTLAAATAVRDAGIEAMDALNSLVLEVATRLPEADGKSLNLAIAKSMSSILDNIVNPALREYPELEVDESTWGTIAATRARSRLSSSEDHEGKSSEKSPHDENPPDRSDPSDRNS